VVLFGGTDANNNLLNDTWTWDGTSWTQHNVLSPPPRYGASMAALNGTVVLFGGRSAPNGNPVNYPTDQLLNDTWTWDGTTWTQHDVTGPTARYDASMAALGGSVVLFGGWINSGSTDSTWIWNGSSWTEQQIPGPAARYGASMATFGATVLLYGGQWANGEGGEDTWSWNGSAWSLQEVGFMGPPGYVFASMGALSGSMVLFGGSDLFINWQGPYNQTWTWNGSAWTQQPVTGPGVRMRASMAALKGTLVLFGGQDAASTGANVAYDFILGDTWVLNSTTWTKQNVSGPSARYGAAMATLGGQ
jgi:N-acetylneuraminic acid mutarotase